MVILSWLATSEPTPLLLQQVKDLVCTSPPCSTSRQLLLLLLHHPVALLPLLLLPSHNSNAAGSASILLQPTCNVLRTARHQALCNHQLLVVPQQLWLAELAG